eukprot:12409465-Karenia_brevis.AAC.1
MTWQSVKDMFKPFGAVAFVELLDEEQSCFTTKPGPRTLLKPAHQKPTEKVPVQKVCGSDKWMPSLMRTGAKLERQ